MYTTAIVRNAILVAGLAACSSGAMKDTAAYGRTARVGDSLARVTRVDATIQDSLSSRTNKAGDTLRAIVSHDISDSLGAVVIPAGSNVTLRIGAIEPGNGQVRPEGRLALLVSAVSVNGRDQALTADLEPVAYHMAGRAVTTHEAARADAGAVISDLVVSAGTPIAFKLSNTLNVTAR